MKSSGTAIAYYFPVKTNSQESKTQTEVLTIDSWRLHSDQLGTCIQEMKKISRANAIDLIKMAQKNINNVNSKLNNKCN